MSKWTHDASRERLPIASRTDLPTCQIRLGVIAFAVAMGVAGCSAVAQDTRHVMEPTLPEPCILLKSALIAPHGIAPADERWVDTARIQMAIDHCARGQAVELTSNGPAGAFLSGALHLHRGVTLLIDKDVTLYASRNPRDYDVWRGSCGTVDDSGKKGCYALIEADHASHSGVMGEGVIDGRGGSRLIVNGKVRPESWWILAEEARMWGHQQVPRLIDTNHSDDFTVYDITLRNSPGVHLGFHNGDGLTVWAVKIDSPKGARNTDGIDPSSAKNVTVADSYIRSGNDSVAIKAGHKPSRDVSILRNHFYWGHGMSIGSETHGGVSAVLVSDLSLDGPDNGIRIKSNALRGGLVKNVTYEDVCIRGAKVPITLDSAYSSSEGSRFRKPLYQDIVLRNVRVSGGGTLELLGADNSHRIDARFDGVVVTDESSNYRFISRHADIQQGPGPVNFQLLGEDSTLVGRLGGNTPLASCEAKFVPFPGDGPRMELAAIMAPRSAAIRKPGRNQDIISLGRSALPIEEQVASVAVAEASVTVEPTEPVAAQVTSRPALACRSGHCGTVAPSRVVRAATGRLRSRCRRGHGCNVMNVHQRVRHRHRTHLVHRHAASTQTPVRRSISSLQTSSSPPEELPIRAVAR